MRIGVGHGNVRDEGSERQKKWHGERMNKQKAKACG